MQQQEHERFHHPTFRVGDVDIDVGPMFAGKTTRGVDLVKRAEHGRISVMVIKPSDDTRSGGPTVSTHDNEFQHCMSLDKERLDEFDVDQVKADVVWLDEAQFLGGDDAAALSRFIWRLRNRRSVHDPQRGIDVLVSLLIGDALQRDWGVLGVIAANHGPRTVNVLTAYCARCGVHCARHSIKKQRDNRRVDIGGADKYSAVCSTCLLPGESPLVPEASTPSGDRN